MKYYYSMTAIRTSILLALGMGCSVPCKEEDSDISYIQGEDLEAKLSAFDSDVHDLVHAVGDAFNTNNSYEAPEGTIYRRSGINYEEHTDLMSLQDFDLIIDYYNGFDPSYLTKVMLRDINSTSVLAIQCYNSPDRVLCTMVQMVPQADGSYKIDEMQIRTEPLSANRVSEGEWIDVSTSKQIPLYATNEKSIDIQSNPSICYISEYPSGPDGTTTCKTCDDACNKAAESAFSYLTTEALPYLQPNTLE